MVFFKKGFLIKCSKAMLALIVFISTSNLAFGQGDPGEPCDSPDPITGDCNLPLDNWVYFLVLVAVVYGAYRMYQKQKALAV